jgi:hypothetical protein
MHHTCFGIDATTVSSALWGLALYLLSVSALAKTLFDLGKSVQRRRTLEMISECQRDRISPSLRRLWAGVLTGELPASRDYYNASKEGESLESTKVGESVAEETPLGNDND